MGLLYCYGVNHNSYLWNITLMDIQFDHYSDITSWRPKSSETPLFDQHLVQADIKYAIRAALYWLVSGTTDDRSSTFDGILPKGPYPPCLRMADRAVLAGYPRNEESASMSWRHHAAFLWHRAYHTYSMHWISHWWTCNSVCGKCQYKLEGHRSNSVNSTDVMKVGEFNRTYKIKTLR